MRVYFLVVLAICFMAAATTPDYQPPVKINANGAPIVLGVGHANPLVTDWSGDGLKDLIVGQYISGKLRYYINTGTNASPVFGNYTFLQADGNDISLSAG
ncbi:MAG: hypothetical protein GQ565_00125 [Candidatus Aegiribacteria sp.]|nr:hypothetical protein [Candidatus Aegiribacteria sp.]